MESHSILFLAMEHGKTFNPKVHMINAKDKEGNPISLFEDKDVETGENYIRLSNGWFFEWGIITILANSTYGETPLQCKPSKADNIYILGTLYFNNYSYGALTTSYNFNTNNVRADCVGVTSGTTLDSARNRGVRFLAIGKYK